MKVRKLKDDRYQVMREDGASLALSYEEWQQAYESIIDLNISENLDKAWEKSHEKG